MRNSCEYACHACVDAQECTCSTHITRTHTSRFSANALRRAHDWPSRNFHQPRFARLWVKTCGIACAIFRLWHRNCICVAPSVHSESADSPSDATAAVATLPDESVPVINEHAKEETSSVETGMHLATVPIRSDVAVRAQGWSLVRPHCAAPVCWAKRKQRKCRKRPQPRVRCVRFEWEMSSASAKNVTLRRLGPSGSKDWGRTARSDRRR